MARLNSAPEKYGTYDGICVYHMDLYDGDFMRTASSLTGDRVKKDPAFTKTMALAARMANASRLGAAVYNMLPPYRRKHAFYRKLTGVAMKLLKEGKTEGEVVVELMLLIQLPKRKPRKKKATRVFLWINPRRSAVIVAPARQAAGYRPYTPVHKMHLFHNSCRRKGYKLYG